MVMCSGVTYLAQKSRIASAAPSAAVDVVAYRLVNLEKLSMNNNNHVVTIFIRD